MKDYPYNPWENWPETGMAIVSPAIKMDYRHLRTSVLKVQAGLEAQGIEATALVQVDLPDPFAWVATLALLRMGVASMGMGNQEQTLLPDYILGNKTVDLDLVATKLVFNLEWLSQEPSLEAPESPWVNLPAEDKLLRIILTSGTSGGAKAVGATFGDMRRRTAFQRTYWSEFDHNLDLMGLGSTAGFYTALVSFMNGRPYYTPRPVAKGALAALTSFPIELISGSPIQLKELVIGARAVGLNFPSLKKIRLSGAASPHAVMESIEQQFPNVDVEILYGSTEGGGVTRRTHTKGQSTMNVGQALDGVDLQIVDEDDSEVEKGVEGQIRYSTPGLIPGYWNQAKHTAANFKDGYFYPGDRGLIDQDGNLILVGRESEHVNLGGEKVNLQDYDRAACKVSGVEDAAAFVLQDDTGLSIIGLAFVGRGEPGPELAERMLARFGAQRPQRYLRLKEIPRNANGKIDRPKLKDSFLQSQAQRPNS